MKLIATSGTMVRSDGAMPPLPIRLHDLVLIELGTERTLSCQQTTKRAQAYQSKYTKSITSELPTERPFLFVAAASLWVRCLNRKLSSPRRALRFKCLFPHGIPSLLLICSNIRKESSPFCHLKHHCVSSQVREYRLSLLRAPLHASLTQL